MLASRYRLGNQVVLVNGKYASALYDLNGERIQRVSSGMGELLSLGNQEFNKAVHEKGESLRLLGAKLAERGFLDECMGNMPEDYSFDHKNPRFPALRTISFQLGPGADAEDLIRAGRLIQDAICQLSLGSFAFLINGGLKMISELEDLAGHLLGKYQFVLCEFWCVDPKAMDLIKSGKTRRKYSDRVLVADTSQLAHEPAGIKEDGSRLVWGCDSKITEHMMVCRPDYYHLLKNYGESYGCLHFDSEWRVFPDVSEQLYCIGGAENFSSIENLLTDKRLNKYWGFNKDKRSKCRDCEFRYACPNPLSKRGDAVDLGSQPSSCDYDLERGAW